ncbi:MAG: M28 family metallopeptidase [Treponema sp.]|nr:M28 family metallopeptidase [Treponema sp.]
MKTNKLEPWAQVSPYNRYFDFIADKADRYSILIEHAERLKLKTTVINIEGNRHIFIFPPRITSHSVQEQNSFRSADGFISFKGKSPYLLCAHYDRVSGSPGANDNSIAVFHLLKAATLLIQNNINNWIIVFTDKEELYLGEKLEDQGSFTLAKKIKSWGLGKARIYNFDSCGSGDVFIISTTTDHMLKDIERPNINQLRSIILQLRDHALVTVNRLRLDKVLLAPTPFSDDIGFLRAGLASQTITILPAQEAERYEVLLRNRSDFADEIILGRVNNPNEKRNLPETWCNINNVKDTPSRLTPETFEQVVQFITELCM